MCFAHLLLKIVEWEEIFKELVLKRVAWEEIFIFVIFRALLIYLQIN